MKRKFLFILLLIFLPVFILAQQKIEGVVFLDANQNGILDKGEKGLKDVPISDGKTIVLTDENGKFTLETKEDNPIIFLSFPSGYFPKKFWQRVEEKGDVKGVNFPLYKIPEKPRFLIIQVTDIHSTFSDVCYRDVANFVKEANQFHPEFVVATGDLVMDANPLKSENDVVKFFQLYIDLMKNLKPPLFNLPGNHEHPWRIDSSSPLYNRGAFKRFFGPPYYSFNYSGWHFVMLEATISEKVQTGFDEEQLNWLEKDLSLAKDKPTVIFTHQPSFECQNFAHFLRILANNPQIKVVFSGHEHANIYLSLGRILNILTGALSGSWWGDDKPNLDGTPRGYRLIILDRNDYTSAYKWVGEKHSIDVPFMMKQAVLKGKFTFSINVFDIDDSIEGVAVRVDSKLPLISLKPTKKNEFWKTFYITLDTRELPNGDHTLTFYAVSKIPEDGKRLWKLEYPVKVDNE